MHHFWIAYWGFLQLQEHWPLQMWAVWNLPHAPAPASEKMEEGTDTMSSINNICANIFKAVVITIKRWIMQDNEQCYSWEVSATW